MDPNLYFRFAIPGWTFFFAALIMAYACGIQEAIQRFSGLFCNQAVLAVAVTVAVAFLAAPAIGFLANTLVVAFCEAFRIGPIYSNVPLRLSERARTILPAHPSTALLRERERDKTLAAALMVHFEYRLDNSETIDWRRRQRAAFFGNWAHAVSMLTGIILTWGLGRECRLTWVLAAAIMCLQFGSAFIFNAHRSAQYAKYQQRIWADSLTNGQISKFLQLTGTGMDSDKESASHEDTED